MATYADASLSILESCCRSSSGARSVTVFIEHRGVNTIVSESYSIGEANLLTDDAETSTWSFTRSVTDETVVIVSGSSLVALKACISSASRPNNSDLAIDPTRFYGTSTTTSTAGEGLSVFRVFARQQHAFDHCDALLRADPAAASAQQLKVFSFETVATGQRRFMVASYAEFFQQYQDMVLFSSLLKTVLIRFWPFHPHVSSHAHRCTTTCRGTCTR